MNHYHFLLKELIQHPHRFDKKNHNLLNDIFEFISTNNEVTTGSIIEAFRYHPESIYINKLAKEQ